MAVKVECDRVQPKFVSQPRPQWVNSSPRTLPALTRTQPGYTTASEFAPASSRRAPVNLTGESVPASQVQQSQDPAQQLTTAREEMENAVKALEDLPVNSISYHAAWRRVQTAATNYKKAIETAYGVTIDQRLPSEANSYNTTQLDLSKWNSVNPAIAPNMARNTLNLLRNFDTGLGQTADYLARATGIANPYEAFRQVMGPVRFHMTPDLLPNGAKGYTRGQDIDFRFGFNQQVAPMPSNLVIHELGHLLMYRAGNQNGANSALQTALPEKSKLLQFAENWMSVVTLTGKLLGLDIGRQDPKSSPAEVGADVFLFYVRGWGTGAPMSIINAESTATLNNAMQSTIEAAKSFHR